MFDDRLEVDSPGTFAGMVKKENIRYTHFSRNPKIAAFLKDYGYVKEYGIYVLKVCDATNCATADSLLRDLSANPGYASKGVVVYHNKKYYNSKEIFKYNFINCCNYFFFNRFYSNNKNSLLQSCN